MTKRQVKLGGDFSEVLDMKIINSLLETNDVIGSVLRINFMNERLVDLWCNKVTKTDDFFKGTGNMSFKAKINIAINLGLPVDIAQVISKINVFRNNLAHQKILDLSDQQIMDLYNHINHIKGYLDQPIGDIDDPIFRMGLKGGEVLYWDKPDISKNHKLLLMYSNFALKVMGELGREFANRGIESSYFDYQLPSTPKN